ncbi:MAG: hypothetical protein ABI977_37795, partial [Acidobacteriota bacterium]
MSDKLQLVVVSEESSEGNRDKPQVVGHSLRRMSLPLPIISNLLFALGPLVSPSPILSPYEILKLVGFATGAALHLYLCWMILRRYGIKQVERPLLGLGLSIGLWHFGNFTGTIYDMLLDYDTLQEIHRGEWWLRLS